MKRWNVTDVDEELAKKEGTAGFERVTNAEIAPPLSCRRDVSVVEKAQHQPKRWFFGTTA